MPLRFAGAALWAALHIASAWSQAAPSTGHQGHHPGKREGTPAAKAEGRPSAKALAARSHGTYRSPFADYRPFTTDEPLKDWRGANDEVREAGGHAGLVKEEPKR